MHIDCIFYMKIVKNKKAFNLKKGLSSYYINRVHFSILSFFTQELKGFKSQNEVAHFYNFSWDKQKTYNLSYTNFVRTNNSFLSLSSFFLNWKQLRKKHLFFKQRLNKETAITSSGVFTSKSTSKIHDLKAEVSGFNYIFRAMSSLQHSFSRKISFFNAYFNRVSFLFRKALLLRSLKSKIKAYSFFKFIIFSNIRARKLIYFRFLSETAAKDVTPYTLNFLRNSAIKNDFDTAWLSSYYTPLLAKNFANRVNAEILQLVSVKRTILEWYKHRQSIVMYNHPVFFYKNKLNRVLTGNTALKGMLSQLKKPRTTQASNFNDYKDNASVLRTSYKLRRFWFFKDSFSMLNSKNVRARSIFNNKASNKLGLSSVFKYRLFKRLFNLRAWLFYRSRRAIQFDSERKVYLKSVLALASNSAKMNEWTKQRTAPKQILNMKINLTKYLKFFFRKNRIWKLKRLYQGIISKKGSYKLSGFTLWFTGRLDLFVMNKLNLNNLRQAVMLIESGHIFVNGSRIKTSSWRLSPLDIITISKAAHNWLKLIFYKKFSLRFTSWSRNSRRVNMDKLNNQYFKNGRWIRRSVISSGRTHAYVFLGYSWMLFKSCTSYEKNQKSIAFKREHANFIINNRI